MSFSPDGRRLATVDALVGRSDLKPDELPPPADVRVWDAAAGKLLFTLPRAGAQAAFSPDGKWAATVAAVERVVDEAGSVEERGGMVHFWDARTGRAAFDLGPEAGRVRALAFLPDGRFVLSRWDTSDLGDRLTVWEVGGDGARRVLRLAARSAPDQWACLAVSPDGAWLASSDYPGNVDVWDLKKGRLHASVRDAHKGRGASWHSGQGVIAFSRRWLSFSPDSRRLAYAAPGEVRVWDPESKQDVLALAVGDDNLCRVLFSPDGRRLLALGEKEQWHVWDARPLAPEALYDKAAGDLVDALFQKHHLRSAVLERLRSDKALDDGLRAVALRRAEGRADDVLGLNLDVWAVVRRPGASATAYADALRQAEELRRLKPDDADYLNTLAAAQLRVGDHAGAVKTLRRVEKLRSAKGEAPDAGDLALSALALHGLHKDEEARAYLRQLRERMKDREQAANADNQDFLREAEAALGDRAK
jgi:hypothetical protein